MVRGAAGPFDAADTFLIEAGAANEAAGGTAEHHQVVMTGGKHFGAILQKIGHLHQAFRAGHTAERNAGGDYTDPLGDKTVEVTLHGSAGTGINQANFSSPGIHDIIPPVK